MNKYLLFSIIIGIILVPLAIAETTLEEAIVSSFNFSNETIDGTTIYDAVDTYNATIYTVGVSGSGIVGDCLDFENSVDDQVRIGVDGSTPINSTETFSISLWLNWESLGGNQWPIGSYAAGNDTDSGMQLKIESGAPSPGECNYRVCGDGTCNTEFYSPPDITGGDWFHVVLIRNGSTCRVYTNASNTGNQTDCNKDIYYNPIMLGDGVLNNGYDYDGLMDQVHIWDYELSHENIINLYRNESDGTDIISNLLAGGGGDPVAGNFTIQLLVDGSYVNSFSADVNSTWYHTTTGTITTNIYDNVSRFYNVTTNTTNIFDNTKFHNTSNDLIMNSSEYAFVAAYNDFNDSLITDFTVTIDSIIYNVSDNGYVYVPSNESKTITVSSDGYHVDITEHNFSGLTDYNHSMYMSNLTFTVHSVNYLQDLENYTFHMYSDALGYWKVWNDTHIGYNNTFILDAGDYSVIVKHNYSYDYYTNLTMNTNANQTWSLGGIYDAQMTFADNISSVAIYPNCEWNNANYTNPYNLFMHFYSDMIVECNLVGYINITFNFTDSKPHNKSLTMQPVQFMITFDEIVNGTLLYPSGGDNFTANNYTKAMSEMDIGIVTVIFNENQQIVQYYNDNETIVSIAAHVMTPTKVQNIKVNDGVNNLPSFVYVYELVAGTYYLVQGVYLDNGIGAVLLESGKAYKFVVQSTGYDSISQIEQIIPDDTSYIVFTLSESISDNTLASYYSNCVGVVNQSTSCYVNVSTNIAAYSLGYNYSVNDVWQGLTSVNDLTSIQLNYVVNDTLQNYTVKFYINGVYDHTITSYYRYNANYSQYAATFEDVRTDFATYKTLGFLLIMILAVFIASLFNNKFEDSFNVVFAVTMLFGAPFFPIVIGLSLVILSSEVYLKVIKQNLE